MKITIVCDVLGKANNGTTLAALNLIQYLSERGHQVTVIAPGADAPALNGLVPVDNLHLGRFLDDVLRRNGVQLAHSDKKVLEQYIRDTDIVHLLLPFPMSMDAIKLAKKYQKPITASFHCQAENITAHLGLMNFHVLNYGIYRFFYRHVYRYCDAVHYPTEFIHAVFESHTHTTPAYVISNGVNDAFIPPAAPPQNEKFTILCSGRYSREKAQWQLLQALAKSRYRNKIHLVLAGDGPRKQAYEKLAAKLGIDCTFRQFSHAEMVEALQSADLYVHTAIIEIEAIACMEAICCGLVPVICNSPRSATRFFSLGEHTLFQPYDIADLAAQIDYWIENPAERAARSAAYQAMRSDFSQKKCMAKMEQMLLDVTNKQKSV